MSASIVKEEILKFLGREAPEVLCIRGKWGVGKSYVWAKQLELSHQSKTLKVPRYSYVSLFGINSLDELKFAIFENVITLSGGMKKADLETLGITNIRVIKRITRFAYDIKPLLAEYDQDVLRSAISSVVLFSWSHDQPEEAPPLTFLRDRTPENFGARVADNLPPSDVSWSTLLEAYGFAWMDDLDLVLIDGICDGYFDDQRLKNAARTVHDKIVATKADGSFEEAWSRYHDSFADDQDEVLDGLYESFMRNFKYVTPTNLNGTVVLFKELGRLEQASEMLRHYVENRNESREFFDLDESLFGGSVTDPDVRRAFQTKAALVAETRDLPAILLSIKDSWDEDVLSTLATAPVEEYRRAFKSHSGKELRRLLANAFQFDRVVNASDAMREISRRARTALELIGSESPINARRVRRYGVASAGTSGGSARGSDVPI